MSNPGAHELGGNFPPPPPGPPPNQQEQHQQPQQAQLQAQLQAQQHPAFDAHTAQTGAQAGSAPIIGQQQHQQTHYDQQQPLQHSQQQSQYLPDQQQQQHAQQQQPYFAPPPTTNVDDKTSHHQQQQQHQEQQGQYNIPAYNPANPVFAPPPTSGAATASASTTTAGQAPASGYATGDSHVYSPSQHHQQQAQQQQAQQADQHGQKKSSWGGRFAQLGAKVAAPINSVAHKLGSQSFLPETLDKECDKASVILKSFCKKGVYADPGAGQPPTSTDPKAKESTSGVIDPTKEKPKNRVLVTIPPKVISKAVGLAIFTTFRAGFQVSGATGSGILIARLPDGSWSPPSGINVHSVGGGFQIGLDIYDCVCVINSKEALAAFMNTRVSLGSDLAVVAGPYGAGGAVDFGTTVERGRDEKEKKATGDVPATTAPPAGSHDAGLHEQSQSQSQSQSLKPDASGADKNKRRSLSASGFKPVFSYVKSRGFYAGVQVDGTVVVERKDANAAFYGTPATVQQILQGQVPSQGPQGMWPTGARGLLDTLRGAEAGMLDQHHGAGAGHVGHGSVAGVPPGAGVAPDLTHGPAGTAPSGLSQHPVGTAAPGSSQHSGGGVAPGSQYPAGGSNLPAYRDDGTHGHVSDAKYA